MKSDDARTQYYRDYMTLHCTSLTTSTTTWVCDYWRRFFAIRSSPEAEAKKAKKFRALSRFPFISTFLKLKKQRTRKYKISQPSTFKNFRSRSCVFYSLCFEEYLVEGLFWIFRFFWFQCEYWKIEKPDEKALRKMNEKKCGSTKLMPLYVSFT